LISFMSPAMNEEGDEEYFVLDFREATFKA
jgi:hypothetical protein